MGSFSPQVDASEGEEGRMGRLEAVDEGENVLLEPRAKHSQLCPVWTKKAPIGECDCWILRNAVRRACAALTALSAAGRLLPDGGETRDEAEVRYQTNNGALKDRVYYDGWTPERREREFAAAVRLGAEVISERTRTVTTWPDGSTYTSAWKEVDHG